MSATTKSVCVIGCGVSGLVSIKSCLEEGHLVTCYEQYDRLGGTWNYSTERKLDQGASTFHRISTNTSRELTCFSDFPPPEHFPPFPTWQMALEYLEAYARKFDLLKHVQFNTKTIHVTPSEDYALTGRWIVTTYSFETGLEDSKVFDCVLIASGYFRKPFQPSFPGQDTFTGKITHSIDFRRGEEYAGKRVVVVGNSSSAGDVAVDVALYAREVILAVGNGAIVIPPFLTKNRPYDFLFARRYYLGGWANVYGRLKSAAYNYIDHDRTRLAGSRASGLMVIANLESCIARVRIKVQEHLERLDGSFCFFTGDVKVQADHVILATGFLADYSFLDKNIKSNIQNEVNLYKLMWPCNLKHATLAVIGHLSTLGSLWPVMEMQARWAAMVLSRKRHLPNNSEMKKRDDTRDTRLPSNEHGTVKVFATPYLDKIADEIGCRPRISHYLLRDPAVAWRLLMGPLFPVQYRMQGPHSIPHAREHFLQAYSRSVNSIACQQATPQ